MGNILKNIIGIASSVIIGTTSVLSPFDENDLKYMTSYQYIRIIGPEVIRCLNERDKEGLNNLFCDKVKNTEYLNNQIDFMFDYFDKNGLKIEEGGKWRVPAEHNARSRYSGKVVNFLGGQYSNNVILNGKEYHLGVSAYTILKKHPEYVGIIQIDLSEVANHKWTDEETNALNERVSNSRQYLCFDIFNFDYDDVRWKGILPEELYKNEEYSYSFDELEQGTDYW